MVKPTLQTAAADLRPLEFVDEWLTDARRAGLNQPSACCLSTIGSDGGPDARFVDVKRVTNDGFVFATHLGSAKALDIARDARVALTFWWDDLGRQVRVRGLAEPVATAVADELFAARSLDAQIVSSISEQSAELADPATLATAIDAVRNDAVQAVPRPSAWGGYVVRPSTIEFLLFSETRVHERLLFERERDAWRARWLQP